MLSANFYLLLNSITKFFWLEYYCVRNTNSIIKTRPTWRCFITSIFLCRKWLSVMLQVAVITAALTWPYAPRKFIRQGKKLGTSWAKELVLGWGQAKHLQVYDLHLSSAVGLPWDLYHCLGAACRHYGSHCQVEQIYGEHLGRNKILILRPF